VDAGVASKNLHDLAAAFRPRRPYCRLVTTSIWNAWRAPWFTEEAPASEVSSAGRHHSAGPRRLRPDGHRQWSRDDAHLHQCQKNSGADSSRPADGGRRPIWVLRYSAWEWAESAPAPPRFNAPGHHGYCPIRATTRRPRHASDGCGRPSPSCRAFPVAAYAVTDAGGASRLALPGRPLRPPPQHRRERSWRRNRGNAFRSHASPSTVRLPGRRSASKRTDGPGRSIDPTIEQLVQQRPPTSTPRPAAPTPSVRHAHPERRVARVVAAKHSEAVPGSMKDPLVAVWHAPPANREHHRIPLGIVTSTEITYVLAASATRRRLDRARPSHHRLDGQSGSATGPHARSQRPRPIPPTGR